MNDDDGMQSLVYAPSRLWEWHHHGGERNCDVFFSFRPKDPQLAVAALVNGGGSGGDCQRTVEAARARLAAAVQQVFGEEALAGWAAARRAFWGLDAPAQPPVARL